MAGKRCLRHYSVVNVGEPPWFVTLAGQLLLGATEKLGTPNNPVNGWIPGTGSASLNWTVLSRSGNTAIACLNFQSIRQFANTTTVHHTDANLQMFPPASGSSSVAGEEPYH